MVGMTQIETDSAASLETRARAYRRMVDMLDHLGETWRDWPDLAACARRAGVSPTHFQRIFTAWAGLSPKQYQAMLAHGAAGDALRQGASVLEASFEVGLSAPSRLHDLFIAHEGLTPGEAKAGGPAAMLRIGRAPTPFGDGAWLIGPRDRTRGSRSLRGPDRTLPPRGGPPRRRRRAGFRHAGFRNRHARARRALWHRLPPADLARPP